MVLKTRAKPKELLVMKALEARMDLSIKQKQYFQALERGYDGEVLFDSLIEKLECECIILNDLLLNFNNTTFQIDSLIITSNKIYIFEIKNYEGDYLYEADSLFTINKKEIINPLHQIKRSKYLLHQLILNLGFNSNIDASVVFINPRFTLYQAPLNVPFIFPTQIDSLLNKLNKTASSLNQKHKQLAKKLLSLHITDSPYTQIPDYNYDQLQKGITCSQCSSFSISIAGKICVCDDCGYQELVSKAVVRSAEEFKLLFPDQRMTTSIIYDWCRIIDSKKRIGRVLANNYKKIGENRWIYYE